MKPQDELFDLLARLVGVLHEDDLVDDPVLSGMMSQLIQILVPKAAPLPADLVQKLTGIENQIERFKIAAEMVRAYSPDKLKQLADSLKDSGLLKSEDREDSAPETPLEDMMKEHSVLRRMMSIYKECLGQYEKTQKLHIDLIRGVARMVQIMVHDFHEKMEEIHVFSSMKDKMPELVNDLYKQHIAVRAFTKKILESNDNNEIMNSVRSFLDVYTLHGLKEDTELFPSWRKSMDAKSYSAMGAIFHQAEEDHFGKDGEGSVLKIVEEIEKTIGIDKLKTE